MKRKLLMGAFLLAGAFTSNAQIADGSTAPDFTGVDQWGNSHTLSNYTNAGKTVILDIYATWCGPCWTYHQAHVLKDLYNAYGPNGTDEIMIFSVEADASTTAADLNGTGSNTAGNWLEGTPYPIIDDAAIGSAYQIAYYPTIYRICPDGLVYEEGQSTVPQFISSIASNCSQTLAGTNDHAEVHNAELAMCGTDGAPEFEFSNYGVNAITAATFELKENGSTVATENFSGNVAQFAEGTVSFPSMTINGGSTYTVEMTAINGNAPYNATPDMASTWWYGNTGTLTTTVAATTDQYVTVKLSTDGYADEVWMEITDGSGTVVWSEGNENVQGNFGTGSFPPPADPTNPLTNDTDYTWAVPLTSVDCYEFNIYDYYGDGLAGAAALQGSIVVEDNTGAAITNYAVNFGGNAGDKINNLTAGSAGLIEGNLTDLAIYPNPASDVLNVEFNTEASDVTVAILDLQGRTLASATGSNVAFPVSDLAAGSYLVTITTEFGVHTENIVVE